MRLSRCCGMWGWLAVYGFRGRMSSGVHSPIVTQLCWTRRRVPVTAHLITLIQMLHLSQLRIPTFPR